MQRTQKIGLLSGLTVVATVAVFLLHPIAQPLSFHHFADTRSWLGIPNFGNVASNLPFLFVGGTGLWLTGKTSAPGAIRLIYTILFIGVILTGLGSAYYHSNPNNDTLVWDRIPMTIVFMALFSATVAELIGLKQGTRLLIPLVLIGIASVWWWHYTEGQGHGDLRLYYLVQYYPMLFIPLILWLFYDPAHKPILLCLVWVVIWYVIAKLLEQTDQPIYTALGVSGHTFKHLAAAVSTWYFVLLFRQKYMTPTAYRGNAGEALK
jgi:hypothetical protein